MFYLTKIENARMSVPEPEYYDVGTSAAISEGETLALSNGALVKNTSAPEFISCGNASAGAKCVPVYRITKEMVFGVPLRDVDKLGDLKVGHKVTVNVDGLGVTTTTTSGIATIISLNGAKAVDDTVIVKF